MASFLLAAVKRQIAAAAVVLALVMVMVGLALVGLVAFALAIYHHFLPDLGPELAWWSSGAIFLVAAGVVALVLIWRLSGRERHVSGGAPDRDGPALALEATELLRQQLPQAAVPATVVALLAGIAVGLNPEMVRQLIASLRRRPD